MGRRQAFEEHAFLVEERSAEILKQAMRHAKAIVDEARVESDRTQQDATFKVRLAERAALQAEEQAAWLIRQSERRASRASSEAWQDVEWVSRQAERSARLAALQAKQAWHRTSASQRLLDADEIPYARQRTRASQRFSADIKSPVQAWFAASLSLQDAEREAQKIAEAKSRVAALEKTQRRARRPYERPALPEEEEWARLKEEEAALALSERARLKEKEAARWKDEEAAVVWEQAKWRTGSKAAKNDDMSDEDEATRTVVKMEKQAKSPDVSEEAGTQSGTANVRTFVNGEQVCQTIIEPSKDDATLSKYRVYRA